MNRGDFERFHSGWASACEMQVGQKPSDEVIELAFGLLAEFDLDDEIAPAIAQHCRSSKFPPRPAEIVTMIEGTLPSNEALADLAAHAKTPIGKFLSVQIGSDMQRLHPMALVTRMGSFRDQAEDFHRRALIGQYTDAEIRMLVSAGIDPTGPLGPETSGPRKPYRADVARRAAEASEQKQLEANRGVPAGRSSRSQEVGRVAIAEMMATLGVATGAPKPPDTEEQRIARRSRARQLRETGERVVAEWESANGRKYEMPRRAGGVS